MASMQPFSQDPLPTGLPPRMVREGLWVFRPNRQSRGTVAWLLSTSTGPVVVDVPEVTQANLALLRDQGPGRIVLTHRTAHGPLGKLMGHLEGWQVWLQEQEAYLLPTMTVHSFSQKQLLADDLVLYWTPGPTPGSCCLHHLCSPQSLLFCGRLLQPQPNGSLVPVRTSHTFHWGRLLTSLGRLRHWLGPGEPGQIACSTGLTNLSGAVLVDQGPRALAALDLEALQAVDHGPNLMG